MVLRKNIGKISFAFLVVVICFCCLLIFSYGNFALKAGVTTAEHIDEIIKPKELQTSIKHLKSTSSKSEPTNVDLAPIQRIAFWFFCLLLMPITLPSTIYCSILRTLFSIVFL